MTAYYNEHDPKAAAWLRELIKAGHIAPGDVDERSIEDVRPTELAGYTQCHFFAGIGVWSYALRRAGWPDSRPVWTGSCPCQPFSAAGQGGGFADERHLWPAFHWLIEQCRPRSVLGEQVASKGANRWLDLVQTDLEGLGYAFGAVAFPSAGIGAPHIRDRAYWVADSNDCGRLGRRASEASDGRDTPRLQPERFCHAGWLEYANGSGWVKGQRDDSTILKIEPTIEYFASLPKGSVLYIGLRADEDEREGGLYGDDVNVDFPMRRWGWRECDVWEYLVSKGITIPARTDCARCYGQRVGEWRDLWRDQPEIWESAAAQERKFGHTFRSDGRDTWNASLDFMAMEFAAGRPVLERRTKTCGVCRR